MIAASLSLSPRGRMLNRLLLTALLGWLWLLPAHATSVRPLYLEQLVEDAALAFQGSCIGNRSERDGQTGLIVTYTTFAVQEVLKGAAPPVHTIKQIGGRLAGEASTVEGVPQFTPGELYVVLLAGVSAAGFSSPVGLAQGSFAVLAGPSGLQVSNGRDFRHSTSSRSAQLLPPAAQAGLAQAAAPVERIGLDDFKQFVRRQAGAAQ